MGWVCCWPFFMALRGFSQGTPVFPSPQKLAFPNSNSTRYQEDEERPSGYATSKLFLIDWFNIQIGTQILFYLEHIQFPGTNSLEDQDKRQFWKLEGRRKRTNEWCVKIRTFLEYDELRSSSCIYRGARFQPSNQTLQRTPKNRYSW